MKKNTIWSLFMMIALAIVCGTTFTSCGGDDDEIGIEREGGGIETVNLDFDYIIPCTNWGTSLDEVRQWMKGSKFEEAADLTAGNSILGYKSPDNKYNIIYYFDGNVRGLSMAMIYYNWYSMKDFKSWIDYTERIYNVKLDKKEEAEGNVAYTCNTYINGTWCGVAGNLNSYFNYFVAIYGIAE